MRLPALTVLAVLTAAPVASAQSSRWVFLARDHVDLWYSALAQLGYDGIGPLPLYDVRYASELKAEKRTRGVATALDGPAAADLRRALMADSAFEILHFVPVYFAGADRGSMLAALRAVGEGRGPVTVPDPAAQFGAAVVAAVLTTPEQRARLRELVAAVEEEWRLFFGDHWRHAAARRDSALAAAQASWDRDLGVALRPFLEPQRLTGGLILLSPAVGPDGRVFTGRPQDPGDNVVVVRLPSGSTAVPAAAVVKELCAPLASELVAQSDVGNRAAAETASGRLAVRCGERLLARYAPAWAPDYRRVYLEALGAADLSPASFERMFPADSSRLRALEDRLR